MPDKSPLYLEACRPSIKSEDVFGLFGDYTLFEAAS
jgi:hypothetical protein